MKPAPPSRATRFRTSCRLVGGFFVWSGLAMLAGAVIKILLRP